MPLCISIKKSLGEIAREYLQKNDLLNTSYLITRDKDCLIIPLLSDLTEKNLNDLKSLLGTFTMIEDCQVKKSKTKPHSHIEILADILTEKELELADALNAVTSASSSSSVAQVFK